MQQQPSLVEDSSVDSAVNSGLGKNLVTEDELKSPYALDTAVCGRLLYFVSLEICFWILSDSLRRVLSNYIRLVW